MAVRKIKIGFDITNNWDYDSFRQTMKELVIEDDKYTLYLITTNTDTEYVNSAVSEIGMETSNVYQVTTDSDVIDTLNTYNIDIYLTSSEEFRVSVNNTSDETVGILVNPAIQDSYKINPKWVVQMQFWINRIVEDES